MIFSRPPVEEQLDQGDIIDGCPLLTVTEVNGQDPMVITGDNRPARVIVLTQTCDLTQSKVTRVLVAVVMNAAEMIQHGIVKASDVKGPIRGGRVFGWYFLPAGAEIGLPETIVDLRQLFTVRLDHLTLLCRRGQRRARLQPLYREHLAQHFANTYGRIGLPEPYQTLL